MSDWVALVVVAAALYLVECIAWIEAAAVVCFKVPFARRWRCRHGAALPGNERGGLTIADPTNVRGGLVVPHVWPFSISPEGLTDLALSGGVHSTRAPRFVAFGDVKTVRAEFGEIQINGRHFARLNSAALAHHLAGQIRRVWKRSPHERSSELNLLIDETLDRKAADTAWSTFQRESRTVSAYAHGLAIFMFVLAPFVLFVIGPYPSWRYLLAGLFATTFATALAYFRTHSALYPECPYDRWVGAISMLLLPIAAIRCVDRLSRDALCRYSWAVVTPMLCTAEGASAVVRQQFVDLVRAGGDGDEASARDAASHCARWFHRRLASKTKRALDRLQVPVLTPPVREDRAMTAYCPRCHAQFGPGSACCRACPGIELIAYDSERANAQPAAYTNALSADAHCG